jgi:hypothetical protein
MLWPSAVCESLSAWSEWQDLNLRPPRPERGALPGCATLRQCEPLYNGGPEGLQARPAADPSEPPALISRDGASMVRAPPDRGIAGA